jgi:hypothetical protein
MTNAPERIWIEGAVSNEVWKHDKQSCLSPHEYTRTDLIAAMIEEAVQAEREACAETVESLWAYRTCSEVAAAIRARKGGEA